MLFQSEMHTGRLSRSIIPFPCEWFNITEANQNFSKVARRYLVMDFHAAEQEQFAIDEDVMDISKRLMEKNRQAYEVLAK